MIRLMMFSFCLCLPSMADTLCGAADSRVCLQSDLTISLSGINLLQAGSAVVLHIPGTSISSDGTVSGSPEHLYRLEDHGMVNDHLGGIWTTEALETDALGITALAYVLQTPQLVQPSLLTISEFRVCQRVSDGPTEVTLALTLIVVGGKQAEVLALANKRMDAFDTCTAHQGNLPLLNATSEAYLTNVHDYPVSVNIMGQTMELAAGEQLQLNRATVASPYQCSSSAALPLVLFSAEDDIDVVGFPTLNHQDYVIPHLASDTASWQNSLIYAADESGTLLWRQGDFQEHTSFAAGTHELQIESASNANQNWALVLANRGINGFLKFARRDGLSGAAWVEPVRTNSNGSITSTVLYMPHIPADKQSFWAGYSLANTSSTNLDVTMEGFDTNGMLRAVEQFVLPAQGNEVGAVGVSRLQDDAITWVRISANGGITGLELVGGNGGVSSISGFLLADELTDRLSFPLLKTNADYWSGVAVLNTATSSTNGTVVWKDAAGVTIGSESYSLGGQQKKIWVAPVGAVQALFTGTNLVGFCQIGEYHSSRLGAYQGMRITE